MLCRNNKKVWCLKNFNMPATSRVKIIAIMKYQIMIVHNWNVEKIYTQFTLKTKTHPTLHSSLHRTQRLHKAKELLKILGLKEQQSGQTFSWRRWQHWWWVHQVTFLGLSGGSDWDEHELTEDSRSETSSCLNLRQSCLHVFLLKMCTHVSPAGPWIPSPGVFFRPAQLWAPALE